jgi:hypothetical protein
VYLLKPDEETLHFIDPLATEAELIDILLNHAPLDGAKIVWMNADGFIVIAVFGADGVE